MNATAPAEPDYGTILHANLNRVFNERDAARRADAIADIFVADPVMFEPAAIVQGRQAISDTAGQLLAQFGPDFTFVADGPAVGHHGLAVLRWHAGPMGGPITVTGADAAEIVDGRIARLWVLLNPPAG
ncbi:ester cyclase [Rhodopseudomonas sp. P2A-2r]|uniref:ester cyclase n=1 Tax=unclassified Rhodopseudomonas TaxID=2638247 RepID=UPI0022348A18|nr:ester cyclase [Rhodopseudomonas sp. P2A-2r]UZE48763.1 ester cyclase [Rhodopseudomonas sp. P2A-2r]